MDNDTAHHRSYLFTLRLWSESLSDDQREWRGQIQHVTSGETRYFRNWSTLAAHLMEMLPEINDDEGY